MCCMVLDIEHAFDQKCWCYKACNDMIKYKNVYL